MTTWTADELIRIGDAEELQIASRRTDGSLRRFITIWTVRHGDDIYVRSAYGPKNGWFRRAVSSGEGRIRAGGVERDVRFKQPDSAVDADVDRAYHAKYDRYGPRIVGSVVGPEAARTTLRLVHR
ncbi:MAG: DUF2255 family protein [Candidatus Limnocylindria bacterium]